jgi:hypothetical protein
MWWFPSAAFLAFATQLRLISPPAVNTPSYNMTKSFAFKAGNDRFTPQNLIELPRPGAGVANPAGDLVLVPVSKYSFADKK